MSAQTPFNSYKKGTNSSLFNSSTSSSTNTPAFNSMNSNALNTSMFNTPTQSYMNRNNEVGAPVKNIYENESISMPTPNNLFGSSPASFNRPQSQSNKGVNALFDLEENEPSRPQSSVEFRKQFESPAQPQSSFGTRQLFEQPPQPQSSFGTRQQSPQPQSSMGTRQLFEQSPPQPQSSMGTRQLFEQSPPQPQSSMGTRQLFEQSPPQSRSSMGTRQLFEQSPPQSRSSMGTRQLFEQSPPQSRSSMESRQQSPPQSRSSMGTRQLFEQSPPQSRPSMESRQQSPPQSRPSMESRKLFEQSPPQSRSSMGTRKLFEQSPPQSRSSMGTRQQSPPQSRSSMGTRQLFEQSPPQSRSSMGTRQLFEQSESSVNNKGNKSIFDDEESKYRSPPRNFNNSKPSISEKIASLKRLSNSSKDLPQIEPPSGTFVKSEPKFNSSLPSRMDAVDNKSMNTKTDFSKRLDELRSKSYNLSRSSSPSIRNRTNIMESNRSSSPNIREAVHEVLEKKRIEKERSSSPSNKERLEQRHREFPPLVIKDNVIKIHHRASSPPRNLDSSMEFLENMTCTVDEKIKLFKRMNSVKKHNPEHVLETHKNFLLKHGITVDKIIRSDDNTFYFHSYTRGGATFIIEVKLDEHSNGHIDHHHTFEKHTGEEFDLKSHIIKEECQKNGTCGFFGMEGNKVVISNIKADGTHHKENFVISNVENDKSFTDDHDIVALPLISYLQLEDTKKAGDIIDMIEVKYYEHCFHVAEETYRSIINSDSVLTDKMTEMKINISTFESDYRILYSKYNDKLKAETDILMLSMNNHIIHMKEREVLLNDKNTDHKEAINELDSKIKLEEENIKNFSNNRKMLYDNLKCTIQYGRNVNKIIDNEVSKFNESIKKNIVMMREKALKSFPENV
jgi:hypothetical protein